MELLDEYWFGTWSEYFGCWFGTPAKFEHLELMIEKAIRYGVMFALQKL